jgi:hypothetical protein
MVMMMMLHAGIVAGFGWLVNGNVEMAGRKIFLAGDYHTTK